MIMAGPTPANLERLAALLVHGLRVPIQSTYDLTHAPEALTSLGANHTQGKVAIRIQ
jgi:hypothetical protein